MHEFDNNQAQQPSSPGQPDAASLARSASSPADAGLAHGDSLLTAADVAQLLTLKESWVREQTRQGLIPHIQLGRYIRYQRHSLLAWISSQERRRGGGRA